jgi:hypothetical protein
MHFEEYFKSPIFILNYESFFEALMSSLENINRFEILFFDIFYDNFFKK